MFPFKYKYKKVPSFYINTYILKYLKSLTFLITNFLSSFSKCIVCVFGEHWPLAYKRLQSQLLVVGLHCSHVHNMKEIITKHIHKCYGFKLNLLLLTHYTLSCNNLIFLSIHFFVNNNYLFAPE